MIVRRSQLFYSAAATMLLAACSMDPVAPEKLDAPAMAVARIERPQTRRDALTLLACPAWQERSVSASIGPEGGVLAVDGHVVRLPAGAVTEARTFTLTVPASPVLQLQLSGADLDRLEGELEVTISLARCNRQDLDRHALRVVGFADVEDLGEPSASSDTDIGVGLLTSLIASRSTYAVAY